MYRKSFNTSTYHYTITPLTVLPFIFVENPDAISKSFLFSPYRLEELVPFSNPKVQFCRTDVY